MVEDNFLDTNIIFFYSNYTDSSSNLLKKCYLFIIDNSGKFILCWAVLKELNEIIIKRARIHKAVIEKIKNSEYSLEESSLVSFREIPFAKQLYEKFKNRSERDVEKLFKMERRVSELKIEKFLQMNVDKKVIPVNQIDEELVNQIYDIIPNRADCKILASVLQHQKEEENIFNFVTADGKDFDPNGYDYLKQHFQTNYSEENYKFPNLINLLYT